MKSELILGIITVIGAAAQTASAQNTPPVSEQPEEKLLQAPAKALEIIVGTGYTQGFGSLQSGVNLHDVITPGLGVDLELGYRIDPHWSIGVAGEYQEFVAQRAVSARGMTGELAATYHILPYAHVDPFLKFGTGYRLLWENHDVNTPSLLTHGFEPAKLVFGVDMRAGRDVAIAPVVGAALDVLLWQSVGNRPSVAISDPTASVYLFAGLQGRFDVGAEHQPVARAQQQQTVTVTQAVVTPPPPAPIKPVSTNVVVEDEILKACLINLDNVDAAPKFDFDKSTLREADMPVLQRIAECFSTGPLKDAGVKLVGRADPRGSDAYNQ